MRWFDAIFKIFSRAVFEVVQPWVSFDLNDLNNYYDGEITQVEWDDLVFYKVFYESAEK